MSSNKVAETSTSTGTGNITLAGAWSVPSSFITGNRTFNSFYGLNHRFPYMIQDQSGNWEKGVGYLSNSTTLVRENVIDNSLSTTALINFPAGDKLIMVPSDAGQLGCNLVASDGRVSSLHVTSGASATITMAANSLILTPFVLERPMFVNQLSVDVTTGVASTTVRLGIYQVTSTAANGEYSVSLMLDAGAIDSATTATGRTVTINRNLGQGFYLIATVANGAPVLRANNTTVIDYGISQSGGLAGTASCGLQKTDGSAHAALPASIVGSTLLNRANVTSPRINLVGRFL